MERLNYIDNLRGIAFLLMIIQHIFYFYDLSNDYKTSLSKNMLIDATGQIARILFILLAGYTLYISYVKNKKKFIKNRLDRSKEILFHAIIITIVTYILYPKYFVRFGILHFLSLGTLLLTFIVPYPKLTLIIFILSLLIEIPKINSIIDTITGSSINYNMMDWFPLKKWLSLLILGLILGQQIGENNINILNNNNILTEIGKNSLNLYTLHIIILLIFFKVYKK